MTAIALLLLIVSSPWVGPLPGERDRDLALRALSFLASIVFVTGATVEYVYSFL